MLDMLWYGLIVVAALSIITGVWLWNRKRKRQKLLRELEESWGKIPEREYKPEDLPSISSYFAEKSQRETGRHFIDDITWHDLDMDRVFMRMNNTRSTVGEENLYALLREPLLDGSALEERNRLIEFFRHNPAPRIKIQYLLTRLGRTRGIHVSDYFYGIISGSPKRSLYYKLLAAGPLAACLGFIVHPWLGILLLLVSLITNLTVYSRAKNETESQLEALSHMVNLIGTANKLAKLEVPALAPLMDKLSKSVKTLEKLNRKVSYVFTRIPDPFMLLETVKIIFLAELIVYEGIFKTIEKHKAPLQEVYETVGLLDSLIAIASFRESVPYSCTPELTHHTADIPREIKAAELYHPLIKDPVANSFQVSRPVLITGSNASGKSTFIKTTAINALLAQTIFTCLAREYSSCYFLLYTSMALKDNLANNESYYIAETKSLKRILDSLNSRIPCLCLIDEVLRGTNTIERIAASSQILHYLASANCLCFAATHDLELTNILYKDYDNYHFQEQILDNEIVFDYRLYTGKANTRNAIKLLRFLGYEKSIVEGADESAASFLAAGNWPKIE